MRRAAAAAFLVLALLSTSCGLASGPRWPGRSAQPAVDEPSPPAGSPVLPRPAGGYVSVEGVTVDICPACMRATEEAGVDVRTIIRGSLQRIVRLLPEVSTQVYLVAAARAIPDGSLRGFARRGSGLVTLAVDLDAPDLAPDLRQWLPPTLAHELHHAERIRRGPGYGDTLLEDLVFEGLAEAFANQAFPGAQASALPPDLERELWQRALRETRGPYRARDYRRWFEGRGDLPRGIGYLLGLELVRSYLERHPGQTPAQLALTDPQTIIRESGYQP